MMTPINMALTQLGAYGAGATPLSIDVSAPFAIHFPANMTTVVPLLLMLGAELVDQSAQTYQFARDKITLRLINAGDGLTHAEIIYIGNDYQTCSSDGGEGKKASMTLPVAAAPWRTA